MDIQWTTANSRQIAEIAGDCTIRTVNDSLDLIGAVFAFSERDNLIILKDSQLDPSFFDLGSGLAGGILQKFANYRFKIAFVGDFAKRSKNFQSFIRESRRSGFFFVAAYEEAVAVLTGGTP